MDVFFFEQTLYFNSHLQGEREKEDLRNSSIFENEFIFFFIFHHVDVSVLASENKIIVENKNPNQQNNAESKNSAINIDKNLSNILNNEELEG